MNQLVEKTSRVKWHNQKGKIIGKIILGYEVLGKATIKCSSHGFTKLIIKNRVGLPIDGYSHERESLDYTIKNAESTLDNLI